VFKITSYFYPPSLGLLARRRSRRGGVSAIALICAIRLLNSRVLAIVAVVGVECRASVLRLLLLAIGGRRIVATIVLLVASLVVTLVIATLVAVIVGLVVVVVMAPGLGCHPASAIDWLNATALTTTGDEAAHEKEEEEKDDDACDYPASPVGPAVAITSVSTVTVAVARATSIVAWKDKIVGGCHCCD
jgi:hypothetical protein